MLDEKETWAEKYSRFLNEAKEDCVRIDADIIPNKNIQKIMAYENYGEPLLVQFKTYCFYKNELSEGVMFYSKELLEMAKKMSFVFGSRPETEFWRNKEIFPYTKTDLAICGIHGFFQSNDNMDRSLERKIKRGQVEMYDFELVKKIREELYKG